MTKKTQNQALSVAITAARSAGKLMRANFHSVKKVNEATQHDIKLELDVRCQKLIEKTLRKPFPSIAILGEEGTLGDPESEMRWVVDPIDGTVNFTYSIPHACVSIALQRRLPAGSGSKQSKLRGSSQTADAGKITHPDANYETILGVVYDPFCDELWSATSNGPAMLNGRRIQVSKRHRLDETIISIGFAKLSSTMEVTLPILNRLLPEVRKVRLMGAAALSMVYVASGRFDAYVEYGLRLWDIAAGGLIIERAGGEFFRQPLDGEHTYRIIANNGLIRPAIEKLT
jgi:myo-inositol-1(or 4)-monophosphatase